MAISVSVTGESLTVFNSLKRRYGMNNKEMVRYIMANYFEEHNLYKNKNK